MMWGKRHRTIGNTNCVFLIAEVGVNHNGDSALAHKYIDAAVKVGADAVKFQTFVTDELVSPDAPRAVHHIANISEKLTHYELIKKLELPLDVFASLKLHCEEKNIEFISTPYDIPSAKSLIHLGVNVIKIASSELTNLPLLHVIRMSKIPVILSTGMSTWSEIVDSINFVRKYHNRICILKCTSNYPASPGSINLNGIRKIKQAFPSFHSPRAVHPHLRIYLFNVWYSPDYLPNLICIPQ